MKKIAYISVYRDGTGYGNAAISMIKAIDKAGIDIVPVWLSLNMFPLKNTERISELEKGSLDGVSTVIQQSLPDTFVRIEGVKNIGYFFWETDSFVGSGWKSGCELMDEIWVTTEEQKEACVSSGVNPLKIRIVDQPKELTKSEHKFDFKKYGLENTFKFYTISDYSNKKNINGLMHSFLTEFSIYDNVSLTIKAYISSRPPIESKNHIKSTIQELKKQIGKPDHIYPKIAIITDMLSENDLSGLENSCDCFVSSSRGEGEGLPMVQSALKGKPVIASCISGISKNFKNKGLLIKNLIKKKVFGMNSGAYYNYNENWLDPSTTDIADKMRYVLENPNEVQEIVKENKEYIEENFSIEACAKKLAEIL